MVDSTIHARPDAPSGASGPLPSRSVRPCGPLSQRRALREAGACRGVQPRLRPGLVSQSGQLTPRRRRISWNQPSSGQLADDAAAGSSAPPGSGRGVGCDPAVEHAVDAPLECPGELRDTVLDVTPVRTHERCRPDDRAVAQPHVRLPDQRPRKSLLHPEPDRLGEVGRKRTHSLDPDLTVDLVALGALELRQLADDRRRGRLRAGEQLDRGARGEHAAVEEGGEVGVEEVDRIADSDGRMPTAHPPCRTDPLSRRPVLGCPGCLRIARRA